MSKAYKNGDCPFCHQEDTILSPHHVYGGTRTMKKFSERYGAIVWVCWKCHVTNENSIHRNAKWRNQLKAGHQRRIMEEQGWDMDRWMVEVGENYLGGG